MKCYIPFVTLMISVVFCENTTYYSKTNPKKKSKYIFTCYLFTLCWLANNTFT